MRNPSSVADVNECSEKNGGCDHTCTNTDGGHTCDCNAGYTLAANEKDCLGELIILRIRQFVIVKPSASHICNRVIGLPRQRTVRD
jgi:hypothetical protein